MHIVDNYLIFPGPAMREEGEPLGRGGTGRQQAGLPPSVGGANRQGSAHNRLDDHHIPQEAGLFRRPIPLPLPSNSRENVNIDPQRAETARQEEDSFSRHQGEELRRPREECASHEGAGLRLPSNTSSTHPSTLRPNVTIDSQRGELRRQGEGFASREGLARSYPPPSSSSRPSSSREGLNLRLPLQLTNNPGLSLDRRTNDCLMSLDQRNSDRLAQNQRGGTSNSSLTNDFVVNENIPETQQSGSSNIDYPGSSNSFENLSSNDGATTGGRKTLGSYQIQNFDPKRGSLNLSQDDNASALINDSHSSYHITDDTNISMQNDNSESNKSVLENELELNSQSEGEYSSMEVESNPSSRSQSFHIQSQSPSFESNLNNSIKSCDEDSLHTEVAKENRNVEQDSKKCNIVENFKGLSNSKNDIDKNGTMNGDLSSEFEGVRSCKGGSNQENDQACVLNPNLSNASNCEGASASMPGPSRVVKHSPNQGGGSKSFGYPLRHFSSTDSDSDREVGVADGGVEGAAAPRPGLPSVRPNAMHNRQRQLDMLRKHEDRLRTRAAANQQNQAQHNNNNRSTAVCLVPRNPLVLHVLDFRNVVADRVASWLPIREDYIPGAPEETIFFSLVEGRGEMILFGGIQQNNSPMQRAHSPPHSPPHVVSNALYIISPKPLTRW